MIFFFYVLGLSLWGMASAPQLQAQELRLDELPALREKAMVLQITAKVEENSQEVWNAYNSKVTVPGRPVGIKLVGENLIIAVQFTPYFRQGRYALVAQSQIWINIPNKGMSYKANTHSIPMDFGESIIYLPLGSESSPDNPRIELLLTIYRYGEEPVPEEETGSPLKSSAPAETKQAAVTENRRERRSENQRAFDPQRNPERNR